MQETRQYLGLDIGYECWNPAASEAKPLMDAKVQREVPKKGFHDEASFRRATSTAATERVSPTPVPSHQEEHYLALGPFKSYKGLMTSRTSWLKLKAWTCLRHKAKLSWLVTPLMWAEAEYCSSGKPCRRRSSTR